MGLFQATMADAPKKRTFRKFSYRGVDLDALLDMSDDQVTAMFNARQRRKATRPHQVLKRLRKAKHEAAQFEKPATIKTHLRGMIVVPEMAHSVVGVYNGKTFNAVEIKPEMVGHYLGVFSITYKPVK